MELTEKRMRNITDTDTYAISFSGMLPACDASGVDRSFFLFYEGMVRARSDQKDLTNKSEIKFGSMHNVFTFALQKKTTWLPKQPTE